jgi:hypothetical protein
MSVEARSGSRSLQKRKNKHMRKRSTDENQVFLLPKVQKTRLDLPPRNRTHGEGVTWRGGQVLFCAFKAKGKT